MTARTRATEVMTTSLAPVPQPGSSLDDATLRAVSYANTNIMYPLTTLSSRILPRIAIPAVQKGRIHATHTPAFADIGSRPTTDQMQSSRPKTKWGLDRDMLYIGGGLAAIGAIWYYYATVENARIEKRREGATRTNTTVPPAKGRGQEA